MPFAFVQSTSDNGTSNGAHTLTFSSNVTAGNLVVIGVMVFGSDAGNMITDNLSNSYAKVGASAANGFVRVAAWYGRVLTGGACTITLTLDPGVSYWGWAIHEYSGLDGATPLSASNRAVGNSNAPDSGSVAVVNASSLLFGVWGQATNVIGSTAGSGFTQREAQTNGLSEGAVYTEDKSVSSGASATFSAASACNWACVGVVFSPSPAAPQAISQTVTWTSTFAAAPSVDSGITWSQAFTLTDSYDSLAQSVFWHGRFAADVSELAGNRYRR